MGYPQANIANTLGRASTDMPATPKETVNQVLDQTQEKLTLIENQVDEVMDRLFNFPRPATTASEKTPHIPAVSERIMELRSRAIRINESLATIIENL